MGKYYIRKNIYSGILILILLSFVPDVLFSQIKVFERPSGENPNYAGLYPASDTRKKIDLNGQWEISFNEGKSYDNYIVPIAYDFIGSSIFRRKIKISEELLKSYSFIFVAGLNGLGRLSDNSNLYFIS